MKISVIIPTLNEEERIANLVDYLLENKGNSEVEIIVIDAGSKDKTVEILNAKNVRCEVCEIAGRANQMNRGAMLATGDVLYFVHADTLPPSSYSNCIKESILNGYPSGCFSYVFDSKKLSLRVNSFFTQFNGFLSGGGDQTLYVTKTVFNKLGGFNPEYIIMEDFEFSKRLKSESKFNVLKSKAIVSARKYEKNSYFKVNSVNLLAMILFWIKVHPKKILTTYRTLVKY